MQKINIELSCCLCAEKFIATAQVPVGWSIGYQQTAYTDERCFCPKHAAVGDFLGAQCPGCICGWGDCGLYKASMYSSGGGVSQEQMQVIMSGRCPFRVNGTMTYSPNNGLGKMDLSDLATEDAGKMMHDAITDYFVRWFHCLPWDAIPSPRGLSISNCKDRCVHWINNDCACPSRHELWAVPTHHCSCYEATEKGD